MLGIPQFYRVVNEPSIRAARTDVPLSGRIFAELPKDGIAVFVAKALSIGLKNATRTIPYLRVQSMQ